jgi:hypothetical protein
MKDVGKRKQCIYERKVLIFFFDIRNQPIHRVVRYMKREFYFFLLTLSKMWITDRFGGDSNVDSYGSLLSVCHCCSL